MKKILKFTAITALLFTTSWSMANEAEPLLVSTDSGKGLIVKWDTPFKKTTVKIFDASKNMIFSDDIVKKENHALKFNLNQLEKGIYTLKIEDFNKIIEYDIQVNGDSVEVLDKAEVYKPIFIHKEKKLAFNLLNVEDSPVDLKVYDSENRLVSKETLSGKSIAKTINFESAYKDTYTVVLMNGITTFSEKVVVE